MSGLATREESDALFQKVKDRHHKRELERLKPALIRLWDGDYVLRGEVAGWREYEFEFIENDTGMASIQLSLDHYLAKWIMAHKGRSKRNVHVTFDKQGARWAGRMDHYRVVKTREGDRYLDVVFKHDYEEAKHILCWANPFLRPEVQFPKLWIAFGPAKFALLITLFVNILRLETSLWTLPDNPLDPTEWMGPSFIPTFWRNIIKPFDLLSDNSPLTIVFSRFRSFHDMAKKTLADAQLTVTCRRYLKDEDPHPFSDLVGTINGLDIVEDLYSLIPLRHGCLVWDIEDNSGWGAETAFGGSLLVGFVRALIDIGDDGTTEGVSVFTGDPTFPGEYYAWWYLGTSPRAPWVVFEESPLTGIESSEFRYYEATDTSFLTGGKSVPGVNEAISAGINLGGDFLTSLINTQISLAASVSVGWGANASVPPIDIPPLGGLMDAVLRPLYEDVFLAFMEIPTTRATSVTLPIPGLENLATGLGDFHYYEGWADGVDKAFTLSAILAVRAKLWATRTRTSHTLKVSDAAPYLFGEKGFGHLWLGDRAGSSVLGYPEEDVVFVERVTRLKYKHDKDGPSGWEVTLGQGEHEDPVMKAFEFIREVNQSLGQVGLL